LIYVLFFVGVTAVWGWTFVVVKNAIAEYPTLPFLQLRFILAFFVLAVLVRRLPTRRELLVGLVVGSVLAVAYLTQTLGLSLISPGNAGLITGLLVLFTPLLDRVFGVPLKRRTIVAVIVAVIGIGVLTGGPSGFGLGDVLVIVCAVLFALHIVLLSRWSPRLSAAPLAMVQMGACALIFSAGRTWTLANAEHRRADRDRDHGGVRPGARLLHPDVGSGPYRREPDGADHRHGAGLGGGRRGGVGGPEIRVAAGCGRCAGVGRDSGPRTRASKIQDS
jgi:hypothetical protein